MHRLLIVTSLLLLVFAGCEPEIDNSLTSQVEVTGGTIEGILDEESGIFSFKGIPFAAPPVESLRWKAPQPVIPWDGVRETKAFGPSPIQTKPVPFMFWSSEYLIPEEPISEDCLYLNVWTGASEKTEKRPVLVYIYGGGFQSGGAGCPIYDGTAMAKKGVVFVSINYRVGALGFLAHPELTAESDYGASGNYGILDMIASLKWVKDNISQFGGDPENVTIAGQSAGSVGVNNLTASPLAKGLFQRAIGESGASFYAPHRRPAISKDEAEQMGLALQDSLGLSSLAEMRQVSAEAIRTAGAGTVWPYVDGYLLDKSILEIYEAGEQNPIDLLVGWNDFDIVSGPPSDEETWRQSMEDKFGEMIDELYLVYPASDYGEIMKSHFEMSRDEFFGINTYTWGKLHSKTSNKNVYIYNFNRQIPAYSEETNFGAFHTGEVPYAYNNLDVVDRPYEDVDYRIADVMSDYWVNFARTGNPNGEGIPNWEKFDLENENVVILDTEIRSEELPTKDKLLFWEKYFSSK